MPSIHHEIIINLPPEKVWEAARDFGALHTRLVPGFVANTEMVDGAAIPTRRVTFANGMVVDEALIALDDNLRRLVWSVTSFDHHNGALQVLDAGGNARVTWTADVLPAELVERMSPAMMAGLAAMKAHLET